MSEPTTSGTAIVAGIVAAVIVAGGLVALGSRLGPSRPKASGDTGVLAVYAQTRFGPVRLIAEEKRELPRPQDFAFQFTCEGTGPRVIRIEWTSALVSDVLHEEKVTCPANMESLEYVLSIGDDSPNDLELRTIVEAPHDHVRTHRFPIRLVGRD